MIKPHSTYKISKSITEYFCKCFLLQSTLLTTWGIISPALITSTIHPISKPSSSIIPMLCKVALATLAPYMHENSIARSRFSLNAPRDATRSMVAVEAAVLWGDSPCAHQRVASAFTLIGTSPQHPSRYPRRLSFSQGSRRSHPWPRIKTRLTRRWSRWPSCRRRRPCRP